jgi:hypothetical protein
MIIATLIAFLCISSSFCGGAIFGALMARRSLEDEYASRYLGDLQAAKYGGTE